jgi:hypothetical protein
MLLTEKNVRQNCDDIDHVLFITIDVALVGNQTIPERVIASEKVPEDKNGEAISWPGAVGGSQDASTVLRDVCFERKAHVSGKGFRERHLMGLVPASPEFRNRFFHAFSCDLCPPPIGNQLFWLDCLLFLCVLNKQP